MVTLRDVLGFPRLGLTLVVGEHSLDTEIRWAHVSELDDPTPWLEGGELLLTTGLNAQWSYEHALDYCQRLVLAGVAALGVSTGPDVSHAAIPAELIQAARDADLALVDVPNLTRLQSVVRAVADAINAESNQPLRSTVQFQRQLSEAATSANGLEGVLALLRREAGLECVVYDTRLHPLTAVVGPALTAELREQIRRRVLGETRGSMTLHDADSVLIILPLGTEGSLRGVLVARHRDVLSAHQRTVLKTSMPILSLLLDLKHAADAPQRRARQALLEAMLSGNQPAGALAALQARAGVPATVVQVIRARMRSGPQRRVFVAGLVGLAADVLVRNEDDRVTVVLCDPSQELPEALKSLVDGTNVSETGVGKPVEPVDAVLSYQEATRARDIARSRGVPLVQLPDYRAQAALVLLGDPVEQSAFADSVLHPIDVHDRANERQPLLPALQAYFDAIGSLELAAAELGIHRHTMRARLARISEVSGHDLSQAHDYLELWLAVEFRRLHSGRARARD